MTELLPFVLVGLVLLVFQLTREGGASGLAFQPLQQAAATPVAHPALPPTAAPTPRVLATPTPMAPLCSTARPAFVGGIAALKSVLGASMGDALECERAVDDQGDTQQHTTTGLAYYRRGLNIACFTTGWDHWGLRPNGLVHWTGDSVDPPNNALPIAP